MKDLKELLFRLRNVSTKHQIKYIEDNGQCWSVTDQIAHVHSEASEMFDVYRRPMKYLTERLHPSEEFLKETIYVIYSAITTSHLSETYHSDEEILEAFEEVMQKIEKRVGLRT